MIYFISARVINLTVRNLTNFQHSFGSLIIHFTASLIILKLCSFVFVTPARRDSHDTVSSLQDADYRFMGAMISYNLVDVCLSFRKNLLSPSSG
jgi:hypothetical protein